MDINARVERMRLWVARRSWVGLEREAREACRASDPEAERAVSAVDLRPYAAALRDLLAELPRQLGTDVAAVYWEFDVDNDWESAVFLCRSYRPESDGDDDWASDFDDASVIQGPPMPDLAGHLRRWDGTEPDAAVNAYLLSRTVATFGEAASNWPVGRPLCAGYHEQAAVFRILPAGGDIPGR